MPLLLPQSSSDTSDMARPASTPPSCLRDQSHPLSLSCDDDSTTSSCGASLPSSPPSTPYFTLTSRRSRSCIGPSSLSRNSSGASSPFASASSSNYSPFTPSFFTSSPQRTKVTVRVSPSHLRSSQKEKASSTSPSGSPDAYAPCRSLPSIRTLPSLEELMLQRQLNDLVAQRLDQHTEQLHEQAACS